MPQVQLPSPCVSKASPRDGKYPGVAVGQPPRKGKATFFSPHSEAVGEQQRTKSSLCSVGKGRVVYAISLPCWETAGETSFCSECGNF